MRRSNYFMYPGVPYIEKRSPEQVWMEVLKVICDRYEVNINGIFLHKNTASGRQTQAKSYVRQLFCYWMYNEYGSKATLKWLAEKIGFTDHTASSYSIRVFKDSMENNSAMPKALIRFATSVKEDYKIIDQLIRLKCL